MAEFECEEKLHEMFQITAISKIIPYNIDEVSLISPH